MLAFLKIIVYCFGHYAVHHHFITHYSLLITHYSLLITHYISRNKYGNIEAAEWARYRVRWIIRIIRMKDLGAEWETEVIYLCLFSIFLFVWRMRREYFFWVRRYSSKLLYHSLNQMVCQTVGIQRYRCLREALEKSLSLENIARNKVVILRKGWHQNVPGFIFEMIIDCWFC